MRSKKIKKSISSLLAAFMLCNVEYLGFGSVSPSVSYADKSKNQQMAAAIMGVLGVGIPLSGSVKYNYITNDPRGNFAVVPVCMGTTSPTVDETASYRCIISDGKNYGIAQGSAKVTGGFQTITAPGAYKYSYMQGNKKIEGTANIIVSFMINGYEGKTTVGDSSAPYGTFDTTEYNDEPAFTSGDSDTDLSDVNGGGSLCPDGTYYCSSDITPTLTNDSNKLDHNDFSNSNSSGTPDDSGFSSGSSGSSGSEGTTDSNNSDDSTASYNSTDSSGSTNSSGGSTDYGDLIDDLLNDNNSYNSGNNDWASSNGDTDGTSNLDDYFNGMSGEPSESLPEYLTDDILGVDADLLGMEAVDTDGDGVADSVQLENGEIVSPDEYMAIKADGVDGDSYSGYDKSGATSDDDLYNGGLSLQDFLNSVDSLNSNETGDDRLNDLSDNNSLADRIKNLINEKTDTSSGNGAQGMTEQQLFDMAKKLLIANGMSMEDIAKGKNYDKDSAYTEPANAWDMNRITTLLKAKKIKLEGADAIRPEQSKKSLTSTANKSHTVSDSKNTKK